MNYTEKKINMLNTVNEFLERYKRSIVIEGRNIRPQRVENAFRFIINKKYKKQETYFDKNFTSDEIRDCLIEKLQRLRDKKFDYYIYSAYIKFLNKEKGMNIKKITEILYCA